MQLVFFRLARKDMDLAVAVGREFDVPMRLASLALQELTEAINRGWVDRGLPGGHAVAGGAGGR